MQANLLGDNKNQNDSSDDDEPEKDPKVENLTNCSICDQQFENLQEHIKQVHHLEQETVSKPESSGFKGKDNLESESSDNEDNENVDKISQDSKKLNRMGYSYIYKFDENNKYIFTSFYGNINECQVSVDRFDI